MEAKIIWKKGMAFDGCVDGYIVPMDATLPLGSSYGPGPKELVALGIAGCAGMDVIGLLKREKQLVERFEVVISVQSHSLHHPIEFSAIDLIFKFQGDLDVTQVSRAIELSQTVYSGLSAMFSKILPITWRIVINGDEIKMGVAHFPTDSTYHQTAYEG